MTEPSHSCQRPWWKRPPVWLLALVLLGALAYVVAKEAGRPAPMPYGAFLDQVEAGNVASATFYGTEIDGRFKHPLTSGLATGTSSRENFRTRVPDFGDPALIRELRKEHAAIDVASPSGWTSFLSRLPWPLLAFLVLAAIAAAVRIVRGPKADSSSAMTMRPGAGIIGLVSSLFARSRQSEDRAPGKRPGDD